MLGGLSSAGFNFVKVFQSDECMNMSINGVSIIICCYNSEQRLPSTLGSLVRLCVPEGLSIELIIVDNCCSDDTVEVASELLSKQKQMDWCIVRENEPGLMHARMKGASVACYEVIAFVDDDNWPDVDWLERAVEIGVKMERVGAWGGWCTATASVELPDWFSEFQGSYACGMPRRYRNGVIPGNCNLQGAGLFIRKCVWDQIALFLPSPHLLGRNGSMITSGDDTLICHFIRDSGWSLYFCDEMHMKHYMSEGRLNIEYLEKLQQSFGSASLRVRVAVSASLGRHPQWASGTYLLFLRISRIPRLLLAIGKYLRCRGNLRLRCNYLLYRAMIFD